MERFAPTSLATRVAPPTALRAAPDPRPRRAAPMRRVVFAALLRDGTVAEDARLVPSTPPFEDAFAAFVRGTALQGPRGPVAVEDLWPGDLLRTASGGIARLRWRGSTMVVPRAEGQDPAMGRLTRLQADALGLGRPAHDLVLGPRARLVQRRAAVRLLTGHDAALVPAADLVDGDTAFAVTPGSAVEVFHLMLDRHEVLLADGVEVESYHPGPLHALPLGPEERALFLSCFPHVADLLDFGDPRLPRLRLVDAEVFAAG